MTLMKRFTGVTPNPPSNAMRPVITKTVRAFAIAIIVLLVGKKSPFSLTSVSAGLYVSQ